MRNDNPDGKISHFFDQKRSAQSIAAIIQLCSFQIRYYGNLYNDPFYLDDKNNHSYFR
ncbi:MAG: hypothetical protein LBB59_03495 [Campylobacteraceae bacterium]|nr:hypothetical protein [Campylobacteraceae bacterium]